jgi:hypothetical protein
MAHLIDKDDIIDELEKLKRDAELYMTYNPEDDYLYQVHKHQKALMLDLINKLNSFNEKLVETKEIDFEKEFDRIWFDNKFGGYFYNDASDFAQVRILCKHFYELGLKARGK